MPDFGMPMGGGGGGQPPQAAAASNTSAIQFGVTDGNGNLTTFGVIALGMIIFTGGTVVLVWLMGVLSERARRKD